jgi:hypothetical protein
VREREVHIYLIRFGGQPHTLPHSSFSSISLLPLPFNSLFAGCLSWHCREEPKVGDRIPEMKYDTLMPTDIEPYLNGRSWEDLKVGDEIAFPEPNSGPTGESLVGLTFCFQQGPDEKMEGAFISFDANTKMHLVSLGGRTEKLPLRTLPDEIKSKITFEGSDAYFFSAADLGLCTIGELVVCSSVGVWVLSSVQPHAFPHSSLDPFPSFCFPFRRCR